MRLLSVCSFIVFISSTTWAQVPNTIKIDRKQDLLYGRVKTVKETAYQASTINGEMIKGGITKCSKVVYSSYGNRLEEFEYNNDIIKTHTKYVYNTKGNKRAKYEYANDGILNSRTSIIYHPIEKRTELIKYNIMGTVDIICNYWYENNGGIQKEQSSVSSGVIVESFNNVLDSLGRCTRRETLNDVGGITIVQEFNYDEDGNQISVKMYNADERLLAHNTYEYTFDSFGNWISCTKYIERFPERILYEYIEREIAYFPQR